VRVAEGLGEDGRSETIDGVPGERGLQRREAEALQPRRHDQRERALVQRGERPVEAVHAVAATRVAQAPVAHDHEVGVEAGPAGPGVRADEQLGRLARLERADEEEEARGQPGRRRAGAWRGTPGATTRMRSAARPSAGDGAPVARRRRRRACARRRGDPGARRGARHARRA
jgi:hypothetical protein